MARRAVALAVLCTVFFSLDCFAWDKNSKPKASQGRLAVAAGAARPRSASTSQMCVRRVSASMIFKHLWCLQPMRPKRCSTFWASCMFRSTRATARRQSFGAPAEHRAAGLLMRERTTMRPKRCSTFWTSCMFRSTRATARRQSFGALAEHRAAGPLMRER